MIDMAELQSIANSFMETPVVIRHRRPIDKDPENRTGDEIAEWETVTVSATGWFVDAGTHRFGQQGGFMSVTDRPILRLPIGTAIDARDEVTINGQTWTVIDAKNDETWPVMIKAEIVKVE